MYVAADSDVSMLTHSLQLISLDCGSSSSEICRFYLVTLCTVGSRTEFQALSSIDDKHDLRHKSLPLMIYA